MMRVVIATVLVSLAGIAFTHAGSLALQQPDHPAQHQDQLSEQEESAGLSDEAKEAQGQLLVKDYCVACHSLPLPLLHSASLWPSVVKRMKHHMVEAGKPVPTPEETSAIIDYLQESARH